MNTDDGDARIERWARAVLADAAPGAFADAPGRLERAVYEYALGASADVVREADVTRVVRSSRYVQQHAAVVSRRVAEFTDDIEAMAAAGTLDRELSEWDRRVLCALEAIHAALETVVNERRYYCASDGQCFSHVIVEIDSELFADVIEELLAHYTEPSATDDPRAPSLWFSSEIYHIAPSIGALFLFRHRRNPGEPLD